MREDFGFILWAKLIICDPSIFYSKAIKYFGYKDCEEIPKYDELEELVKIWEKSEPFYVFIGGEATSLSWIINKYPNIKNKIIEVYSMIGNVKVEGNVSPDLFPNPNSEYNAFLDPELLTSFEVKREGIKNNH